MARVRRGRSAWLAGIVVTALIGACSDDPRGVVQTPDGPIIDGWHVGEERGGPLLNDRRCGDHLIIEAATAGLDRRDGGHAPIVRVELHGERYEAGGGQYGRDITVVVFQLADGSLRAIGVTWPLCSGSPRPIDFGG